MNFQELFLLGMKRELNELVPPDPEGVALNLGGGNHTIAGAINLDFPSWDAETMPIPYQDGSVSTIYAFHFLEHLPGNCVIRVLREIERVLAPGGTANIVVPHRLGAMAFHDLDHKTFFTERTWKVLFGTPYYDKNREVPWKLRVNFNLVAGIEERCLALFTQLVRD